MHGNEPSGRQLTLATAEHICAHRNDANVRKSLERLHVVAVPTLNPDGFAAETRGNRCSALSSRLHNCIVLLL
jgi:murein tripeptide amidase MpaA